MAVWIVGRRHVSYCLGPATTRGKRPPADIVREAEKHMAEVNTGVFAAERIVTVGDFVDRVYLPWIDEHKRPSTTKGYRDIWEMHLQALASKVWLKDVRTHQVQGWLTELAKRGFSRNSLKHIKASSARSSHWRSNRTSSAARIRHATLRSAPPRLNRRKLTHTAWMRCAQF